MADKSVYDQIAEYKRAKIDAMLNDNAGVADFAGDILGGSTAAAARANLSDPEAFKAAQDEARRAALRKELGDIQGDIDKRGADSAEARRKAATEALTGAKDMRKELLAAAARVIESDNSASAETTKARIQAFAALQGNYLDQTRYAWDMTPTQTATSAAEQLMQKWSRPDPNNPNARLPITKADALALSNDVMQLTKDMTPREKLDFASQASQALGVNLPSIISTVADQRKPAGATGPTRAAGIPISNEAAPFWQGASGSPNTLSSNVSAEAQFINDINAFSAQLEAIGNKTGSTGDSFAKAKEMEDFVKKSGFSPSKQKDLEHLLGVLKGIEAGDPASGKQAQDMLMKLAQEGIVPQEQTPVDQARLQAVQGELDKPAFQTSEDKMRLLKEKITKDPQFAEYKEAHGVNDDDLAFKLFLREGGRIYQQQQAAQKASAKAADANPATHAPQTPIVPAPEVEAIDPAGEEEATPEEADPDNSVVAAGAGDKAKKMVALAARRRALAEAEVTDGAGG